MIQKIYKNTDLLFSIEIGDNNNIIDIADIGELTIVFYTDTTSIENHITVTKDDIINSNQIFLDNSKLDLLNEGLLKYNIKLRFNNTSIDEPFDIAKTVETEYFIKNNNYVDSTCTGGTVDSYSKSEIDLKLSLKANSSDVYSKAETNERLADKANKSDIPNIANLATKDELKLKANSSDVYSKVEIDAKFDDIEETDLTNYYTKIEVDEKIADAGTVDLSSYYKKAEVDNKLSTKVDAVEGKTLSSNDYTDADKTKLQSLSNYDDTLIKQSLSTKADINNVYSKVEVDAKIDDAIAGEVDLSAYYKKAEVDSKLAEKADISDIPDTSSFATKTELAGKADISDIPDISALATKNELSTKANVADVYSKTEVDDLIADIQQGTGTTIDTYTKSQIDTKLANKTDVSRTSILELELNKKANSSDVYTKSEVDDLIAGAGGSTGGTGGTGTTTSEVYILRHDETQATEERAALYTKLYNSFWYNSSVFVLFNVLNGSDEFIVNVNNVYKDNAISRNEIKLSGSYILSSSIFHVEIVLKKDGSFTFTKNNIAINKLNTMQLEERIETLESEIKNPTEMKVDCLNYE
nr:MAG TPA: hypothetical protein [Caudoviricetes sp.]